jgi:hypothetical protein
MGPVSQSHGPAVSAKPGPATPPGAQGENAGGLPRSFAQCWALAAENALEASSKAAQRQAAAWPRAHPGRPQEPTGARMLAGATHPTDRPARACRCWRPPTCRTPDGGQQRPGAPAAPAGRRLRRCWALLRRHRRDQEHCCTALAASHPAAEPPTCTKPMEHMAGAITALQFQDMASQLITHTHGACATAPTAWPATPWATTTDGEAVIEEAPAAPQPRDPGRDGRRLHRAVLSRPARPTTRHPKNSRRDPHALDPCRRRLRLHAPDGVLHAQERRLQRRRGGGRPGRLRKGRRATSTWC